MRFYFYIVVLCLQFHIQNNGPSCKKRMHRTMASTQKLKIGEIREIAKIGSKISQIKNNQNAARPTASKFWVPQSSSLLCATHRHSTAPPAQHFGVTRMLQSNLQRRASITTFVSQIVFNGVTDVFAEKVPVIIMYESSRLTIQNKKIHWAQHADHFNRSDYLFHKS